MKWNGENDARKTVLEIHDGCPAFLCLLGCVWTWRGLLFFVCALLVHELGHALVLHVCGGELRRLRLGFGDIEMETAPLGYCEEALAAWAGPCVNLLLWLALRRTVPALAAVNLLLGAYNLLPILPLDGGRIFSAVLHLWLPEQTAWLICRVWSLFAVICLLAFALAAAGEMGLLPLVLVLGLYARLALSEKTVAFGRKTRYNT